MKPEFIPCTGAVITAGGGGSGSGSGSQPAKDGSNSPKLGRSKSQTSQLAHNYQRAAAAEQQAINDAGKLSCHCLQGGGQGQATTQLNTCNMLLSRRSLRRG